MSKAPDTIYITPNCAQHTFKDASSRGDFDVSYVRGDIAYGYASEVERLTACLKAANANHEKFERLWYLEKNRSEDLRASIASLAERMREDIPANHPEHSDFQHGKNFATGKWLSEVESIAAQESGEKA